MKDLHDGNGMAEIQENEDTSYLAARRIRKMKKLNLQDMSRITGLSVAYLSKYENGKANITIAALRKIAMALEVPVTALLTAEVPEKAFVVQQDKRFKIVHHESENGEAIEEFITRGDVYKRQEKRVLCGHIIQFHHKYDSAERLGGYAGGCAG